MINTHFETSINRATNALTALISDLRRTVQYFDIDIEVEETRASVFNVQSADYPSIARTLRSRRDNLLVWRRRKAFTQNAHKAVVMTPCANRCALTAGSSTVTEFQPSQRYQERVTT
jgi:hypothetical protein